MPEMSGIISQMVSPAVIISAIGLLLLSMNNRYMAITGRVRDLNREVFSIVNKQKTTTFELKRIHSIKKQMIDMLKRCQFIKQAIFLLYLALTLSVLTVLALAGDLINIHPELDKASIFFFIMALFCVLIAIILEGYEITMALNLLKFDVDQTFESLNLDEI